jgi:hypothetical protein
MVGVDHVYIYDNTDIGSGDVSKLQEVTKSFGPDKLHTMYDHTKFATTIGQPIKTQEKNHHNIY